MHRPVLGEVQVDHTVDHGPVEDARCVLVGGREQAEHRSVQELRAAERRGAEAQSVLETLQANAPVGLGLLDTDFRIVRENEMLATFRKDGAGGQVGRLVGDVIPEQWPVIEPLVRRVLETGEPCSNQPFVFSGPEVPRNTLNSYYPVRVDG